MKSLFVSVTGLVTIFFGCLPVAAESSFSSIVTSTAPGSENYSVSCDPEGRGTAYDGAKLDSYDNEETKGANNNQNNHGFRPEEQEANRAGSSQSS